MADERSDLKIEKLSGDNYPSWKRQMKFLLMEKGLWGFVTGTETRPAEEAQEGTRRRFQTNSDRAFALIALCVEKSLQIHIGDTTDPQEAWDILSRQFEFVSTSQIVRLSRKFFSATMQENDDMMEHITLMTTLAQQLRDLGEVITSRKFANTILGSLPESYETFVLTLNSREANELDWESIKGSLQEEYLKRKERNNNRSHQSHEALIMVRGNGRNNRQQVGREQQQRFGNYRNNGGFNRNNQNGSFGNRNNSNRNGRTPSRQNNDANKQCFNCGEFGHIARDCHYTNQGNQVNHNNQEQGNFVNSLQNIHQPSCSTNQRNHVN